MIREQQSRQLHGRVWGSRIIAGRRSSLALAVHHAASGLILGFGFDDLHHDALHLPCTAGGRAEFACMSCIGLQQTLPLI